MSDGVKKHSFDLFNLIKQQFVLAFSKMKIAFIFYG